jgi:hypothetical protein
VRGEKAVADSSRHTRRVVGGSHCVVVLDATSAARKCTETMNSVKYCQSRRVGSCKRVAVEDRERSVSTRLVAVTLRIREGL